MVLLSLKQEKNLMFVLLAMYIPFPQKATDHLSLHETPHPGAFNGNS